MKENGVPQLWATAPQTALLYAGGREPLSVESGGLVGGSSPAWACDALFRMTVKKCFF